MPRPRMRPDAALWLAAALGCAALGPAALHAALAAAAGTLFEAIPFVLAAELAPRRLAFLTVVAGCGCGRRMPGALSLPATALCWIAFGPLVALARLGAGLTLLQLRPRAEREAEADPKRAVRPERSERQVSDALAELPTLGLSAAVAVTLTGALGGAAAHLGTTLPMRAALFAVGCLLGAVAPCATAAVAIAAALVSKLPAVAAGVLTSGGLVTLAGSTARFAERRQLATSFDANSALWSRIGLALALGTLFLRGASGFVNPRLLPFAGAGAVLALLGARRPTRSRTVVLVPIVLLAALATGSPEPSESANATRLDDAYPGERLIFTGRAHRSDAATVLERTIITCCRADASDIALRLSTRLRTADGTWITATGILARSNDGIVLQAASWHAIAPPADPFLYR